MRGNTEVTLRTGDKHQYSYCDLTFNSQRYVTNLKAKDDSILIEDAEDGTTFISAKGGGGSGSQFEISEDFITLDEESSQDDIIEVLGTPEEYKASFELMSKSMIILASSTIEPGYDKNVIVPINTSVSEDYGHLLKIKYITDDRQGNDYLTTITVCLEGDEYNIKKIEKQI